MTQTLTTLPPSQRPPFARLQASVRSGYHAHVSARRNAEYQAHLSVTLPGGSLSAHSRLHPNGPAARKERYERLDTFIRTWCTLGMPGTRPFFEALWAVVRLQALPENLGGAGSRRITWEIDDAVFQEAAYVDMVSIVFSSADQFRFHSVVARTLCWRLSIFSKGYGSHCYSPYPVI